MIYAIVTVLVLIADQAVKFWTTKNIILGAVGEECAKLIPGFVHMTNVHNYGAAFGILQDARWPLAAVSALFVLVIIILINKEVIHTRFGRWTSVLVMAGAIGNCIDRVLYGYVVDMFEFEFALFGKPFSFPVFNVADIFITLFGILFCIHVLFHNEPEAVKEANAPEFIRKRRQAKRESEAKAAARAARAKKPEAVPTAEAEAPAAQPEDELAGWDFGALAEEPAQKREPARTREPARKQEPAPAQRRAAAPKQPETPAPRVEEDPLYDAEGEDESMEFSLEDILNEFGEH